MINLWRKERFRSPGSIIKLSNKVLTINKQDALRFVLNHSILPRNFQENTVKANIDRFTNELKQKDKAIDYNFKPDVKFLLKRFVFNAERVTSTCQNLAIHGTVSALSKDRSIKSCKQIKGNRVVILIVTNILEK